MPGAGTWSWHLGPPEEPSALERVTELFSVSFHRWKDFSDFPFSPSVLGVQDFSIHLKPGVHSNGEA